MFPLQTGWFSPSLLCPLEESPGSVHTPQEGKPAYLLDGEVSARIVGNSPVRDFVSPHPINVSIWLFTHNSMGSRMPVKTDFSLS